MRPKRAVLTLTVFFPLLSSADPADDARDSARVDFARDILPVLSNKCFVCHGPAAKKKNLCKPGKA